MVRAKDAHRRSWTLDASERSLTLLAERGDVEALQAVQPLTHDPDMGVQNAAAKAVIQMEAMRPKVPTCTFDAVIRTEACPCYISLRGRTTSKNLVQRFVISVDVTERFVI
eukprot:430909-Amphidinium_carterae.1